MKVLGTLIILFLSPAAGFTSDPGVEAADIDKVQAAFEKALAANPQNKEALYMLGLIYEKKHQTPAALQTWENYRALETDPEKREIAQKHIHQLSQ